ncbi:MAG: hypothetical protein V4608_00440 [Bacteroidota bacterium]
MFKILNTALSRKLDITSSSGRLVAVKNGIYYFEIDKEDKILKLKCSEGAFNKHFKTDSLPDNSTEVEQKIVDKEYSDLMKFYS